MKTIKCDENCLIDTADENNRPSEIEAGLNIKQPANIGKYQCTGLVFSSYMTRTAWLTIPCNKTYNATFVCQKIANVTFDLVSSNTSTSFQLSMDSDIIKLKPPEISCVGSMWQASISICFTIVALDPQQIMTMNYLENTCSSINASIHTVQFDLIKTHSVIPGIDSKLDTYVSMISSITNEVDVFIVAAAEKPGLCIFYHSYLNDIYIEKCSSAKLETTTSTSCVRHFPSMDLDLSQMATYRCNSNVLIADSFQCDGFVQCDEADDEKSCAMLKVSRVEDMDCSPFKLAFHRHAMCICPALYIACADGTCIPQDALCNNYTDCQDGWDEQICTYHQHMIFTMSTIKAVNTPPQESCLGGYDLTHRCQFDVDDFGNLLHCADGHHLSLCNTVGCPRAFKCSSSYCISVRRVCDGVIDCPIGEDETMCDKFTCSGFLQCRGSGACIPPWEVCDGIIHCKQFMEDEIYCSNCPPGVICKGNAVLCNDNSNISINSFPKDHSWIKAMTCQHPDLINTLIKQDLDKMIFLDIQKSNITHFLLSTLMNKMRYLSVLNTAHNALQNLPVLQTDQPLKIINLAHNLFSKLFARMFDKFPDLMTLILSNNLITSIERWSFMGLQQLRTIDLSHNLLTIMYVGDLPDNSPLLQQFSSDLLELCCVLQGVSVCSPISTEFSSCDNLLRLTLHRVIFMVEGVAIFAANAAAFILKKHFGKKERLQLLHMTCSNLLMAVYLLMISVYDIYYRDDFVSISVKWKFFISCRMMAFVNHLSSEVTISLLLYISIFRAYSLNKVFSHLSPKTTWLVCFFIWCFWLLYILIVMVLFHHYNTTVESNMCILVFLNKAGSSDLVLIHSLLFVSLNLMILVMLYITYSYISWRVLWRSRTLPATSQQFKKRQKTVSLRLIIILLLSTCCWLPVLITVILSLSGFSFSAQISVWMTMLVLPINASFCPVVYCLIPIITSKARKNEISTLRCPCTK